MAKTRMIHAPDTSRRNVSTPKRSAHLLAKLEEARVEWELVHIKTQAALERAKRRRDC
jgi:hypothetical protein